MKAFGFITLTILAGVVTGLIWGGSVHAETYGQSGYGSCVFGSGCAAPTILPTPAATPLPTTETDPYTVSRDVDGDGGLESATDTNRDSTDGFEQFADPDGSSAVNVTVDADDDGRVDFLLNTDDDEYPDVYWDPDDDIVSTVQLVQCGADLQPKWRFDTGSSIVTYDPVESRIITECAPLATTGTGNRPGGSDQPDAQGGKVPSNVITGTLLQDSPIYGSLVRRLERAPKPVVVGIPYALLGLLGLLVVRLVWQTRNELRRIAAIAAARERAERLALEKKNFVVLTSHYLRTPITIIRGNIDVLEEMKRVSAELGKLLEDSGQLLLQEISAIVDRLTKDERLEVISANVSMLAARKLVTVQLLLPLFAVVGLVAAVQFMLIDARLIAPSVVNLLIPVVATALIAQLFFATIRKRQINRNNRLDQQQLLDEQQTLDSLRNEMISQAANRLEGQLQRLRQQLAGVQESPEKDAINKSIQQLADMVAKFRLVTLLQSHGLAENRSSFTPQQAIDAAIQMHADSAAARAISFDVSASDGLLNQQSALTDAILESLVDNAVKFSPENARVTVTAERVDDRLVQFAVKDSGKGISRDKQELLFKPFSRVGSAVDFDHEGLGFSLYLDKLIAHYLGGDVRIESAEGKGTKAVLTLPLMV